MNFTMNSGGASRTALLRGAYGAALGFAGTALTTYAVTDDLKASLISAGIAACIALGWRAGVEGSFDASRNNAGEVRQSDVTRP